MPTWIALLRGINVGGRHSLKMADLRALLESLGLENVRTYIQSGNVVFEAPVEEAGELGEKISDAIEASRGFRPRVQVVSADRFKRAIEANPYPEAESSPKSLHLFFLFEAPADPDFEKLDEFTASSERYELIDDVFYLYAPDGIGRSKLAERAARYLGVDATARNWRTAIKLMEMIAPA